MAYHGLKVADLSDISEGGMMVLLSRHENIDALRRPLEIESEIVSENTALQFAPGIELPRALLDAVAEEPA
ncbi:MAG: hypothetical protein OHK0011_19940 [Turneriella sp.]